MDTPPHSGTYEHRPDEAVMATMLAGQQHESFSDLAKAYPAAVRGMGSCCPTTTAATIARMLTEPPLQANCLILETMVHLALARGRGHRTPKQSEVAAWFQALRRGRPGHMQDPAEDVFVSRVPTRLGNFRIFEGIWEKAGFYLLRLFNALHTAPAGQPWDSIRSSVHAMLILSEAVAERAGVPGNTAGGEMPLKALPSSGAGGKRTSPNLVRFSPEDLAKLAIKSGVLDPFVLEVANWSRLGGDSLGHTALERRPLVRVGRDLLLLLPTAASSAIRRYIIEECIAAGYAEALERALGREYGHFFAGLPLLGGKGRIPLRFQNLESVRVAQVIQRVDEGRYYNWVFHTDTFEGYDDGGVVGFNSDPARLERVLNGAVMRGQREAATIPGFQSGITIVVSCGWGRGLVTSLPIASANWRVQSINAADLETLSLLPDRKPLSLWRTLASVEAVRRAGMKLRCPNGLLNLVAWEHSLGGSIAPHAELPVDFGHGGTTGVLMVPQNGLLALRLEVVEAEDAQMAKDGAGQHVLMRRRERSAFKEGARRAALYESWSDAAEGRLRAACLSGKRAWWIKVNAAEDAPTRILFEQWEMLGTWLAHAVPVLEAAFPNLPLKPVTWEVQFAVLRESAHAEEEPPERDAIPRLLTINVDGLSLTVHLDVAAGFDFAFHHPDNVAEVALVTALVEGTARLAGQTLDRDSLAALVARIIPSGDARHIHFFQAQGFRDYIAQCFQVHPIMIERQDTALVQIGLAWLANPRARGGIVASKADCTKLLNETVTAIERKLCSDLRRYGRQSALVTILQNYEAACFQRDRWQRTAAANVGLRPDRAEAVGVISEHQMRLNTVTMASRILAEAAMCECPDEGLRLGELDISGLMASAMLLFRLGGWSDAIRWDAMEPRLKLSALGNIMVSGDFDDMVLDPFGRLSGDVRVEHGITTYAGNYQRREPPDSVADALPDGFMAAWRTEFGFDLDEVRSFLGELESLGAKEQRAVVEVRRSDLVRICTSSGSLSEEITRRILVNFTLNRRTEWRAIPPGFSDRDRQPWKFRRRLSLMRRPIIELDGPDHPDPRLLVAPGMVGEHLRYLMAGLLRNEFPENYFNSTSMRSWIGGERTRAGHAFNAEVAARMRELGWEVLTEVSLPHLLGHPTEKNFGDVDVLAWKPLTGRVLIMECKDLQLRKTPGEVAEQLADFRGGLDSRDRPDLLLKHLLRCEQLEGAPDAVGRRLRPAVPLHFERYLVFRNPVPMQFAWQQLTACSSLTLLDHLHKL